jgi:hypothetical protein
MTVDKCGKKVFHKSYFGSFVIANSTTFAEIYNT